MSIFNPMPDLAESNNNNSTNAANNFEEERRATNEDQEMRESDQTEHLAVETKTSSKTHCINWIIDARSLHIAQLANKGEKRGVIEANVEKEGHRFKLELCASGWRNSQDGYCAFYLTVQDQDELFVARYRVQVGTISRISSIRHDFHLGVGFPNFCEQSQLEQIMSNSCVRFLVTVEIFSCKSNVQSPTKPLGIEGVLVPQDVLSKLMKEMFQNKLYSDISLLCQSYRIPVHKCVLAHASPVFRAIFSHNFVENSTNQICMNEWRPEIVDLMVTFLYTARIEDPNEVKKKFSSTLPSPNMSIDSDDEHDDEISQNYATAAEITGSQQGTISASPSLSEGFYASEMSEIERTATSTPASLSNFINSDLNSLANMVLERNPNQSVAHVTTNQNINNLNDFEMKGDSSEALYVSTNNGDNHGNSMSGNLPKQLEYKDEEKDFEENILVNSNSIIKTFDPKPKSNKSCNVLNSIQHATFELFQLAEFYKIETLVIACCQKMHQELTNESACDLLVRIERYSHVPEIKTIKESIWKFITNNIRDIKQTIGYSELVKYHPDLLGQLIDQMTK